MAERWLEKLLIASSLACAFAMPSDHYNKWVAFYPWGEKAAVEEAWRNSKECTWKEILAGECANKRPDANRGKMELALRTRPFISVTKEFVRGNIVVTPRLVVNTSSAPYASLITMERGEKNLVELCHSAQLEEAWIYSQGIWIEMGKAESYSGVSPDYELLELAAEDVSIYHFHPIDMEDNTDDSQFPSPNDFVMFAKALKRISMEYPSLKPDFRVAVSSGIYTIKFADNALDDEKVLGKVIEKMGKTIVMFATISDYSQGNRPNFAKNNDIMAKALSNEFVNVEFRAIDKY